MTSAPRPEISIEPTVGWHCCHPFPDEFSAHWVRVIADRDCAATAYFIYD